ncbi:hypothetical protein SAMD00019534_082020 [Acytostelium subglobosum LB1]|uniref:hypothetical protein n=1 Tax=Acytostelium subglobosum LB1 TaxID=1410327 RepID=UPI000644B403|nr:hypothetical protein SAMD00019534_082020 [Acytostelium subglobosum LB1]GAM25027.1 hypothetical protein SAMD00019534_082020 [Acytostelium subglobosum LB1]|eukprot:XP_012752116.1 hypothetical protein SAMD00019534_082020 [Acytostelium subglobosum LB1]
MFDAFTTNANGGLTSQAGSTKTSMGFNQPPSFTMYNTGGSHSNSPIPMLNNDGTTSPTYYLNLSMGVPVNTVTVDPETVQEIPIPIPQFTSEPPITTSAVPSSYCSPSPSSSHSSPIQDFQYMSPQSPQQQQQQQQMSPQQHQQQQYSSSPLQVIETTYTPDYNVVFNYVQKHTPKSDMVPLNNPFQLTNQQQVAIPIQQQHQQQPQQQQQSNSFNSNEYDDMLDKPFSKDYFFNQLKSAVPAFVEPQENAMNDDQASNDDSSSSPESDGDLALCSKKRGREEVIDLSGATILNKDQVLKLTSREIEEYVSKLKQNHILSPSQEKELKKQRRLIKNREYASQSRSRRKVYVESIESKLQRSANENASIKSQLTTMKDENRELKKQLFTLTQTLKSNPSLAEAFGKVFSIGNAGSKKTAATVSLFVFCVLFTLTFLFPVQPTAHFQQPSGTAFVHRNLLDFDISEPVKVTYVDRTLQLKNQILDETKAFVSNLLGNINGLSTNDKKKYEADYLKHISAKSSAMMSNSTALHVPSSPTTLSTSAAPTTSRLSTQRPTKRLRTHVIEEPSSPLTCSSPLSSSDMSDDE